MAIIVSDNSPLNLLIRLRQQQMLPTLFGQVIIPTEVVREMRHAKAPQPVRIFIETVPDWLTIQSPVSVLDIESLDAGESAPISLAIELNSPLMIDERDGRTVAKSRGLEVIGAIGVLERAAEVGLISDLASVYDEIRSFRFHIADHILQDSLQRHLHRLDAVS